MPEEKDNLVLAHRELLAARTRMLEYLDKIGLPADPDEFNIAWLVRDPEVILIKVMFLDKQGRLFSVDCFVTEIEIAKKSYGVALAVQDQFEKSILNFITQEKGGQMHG